MTLVLVLNVDDVGGGGVTPTKTMHFQSLSCSDLFKKFGRAGDESLSFLNIVFHGSLTQTHERVIYFVNAHESTIVLF